jgi:hypothetical protein
MPIDIFRIAARKSRPGGLPADLHRNFELRHTGVIGVNEFWQRGNLSLYCIDPAGRAAAFVETPSSVDLAKTPFLYHAQYDHALNVILVPYEELHVLAARTPEPAKQTLIIHSVGRCGSTLLTNMLGAVENTLSLSEPDVYTQICALRGSFRMPPDEAQLLLRSCTKMLRPGASGWTWLTIKFRSEVARIHADLTHALPDARPVFMYRSAYDVVASYDRIWGYPFARRRWLFRTRGLSQVYKAWRRVIHGRNRTANETYQSLVNRRKPADVLVDYGTCGLFLLEWLMKVRSYLDLRRDRPDAVAVRYEDLVRDPAGVVARLFQHLNIDVAMVDRAVTAMGSDAHAGTGLARSGSKHRWDERDRTLIEEFFRQETDFGTPDVVLPGTLKP